MNSQDENSELEQDRTQCSDQSESSEVDTNSGSEDDFISSGDELTTVISSDEQRHNFGFASSLSEHTEYFTKTLAYALDSVQMDKSLVTQAQISGKINNKNQKLIEKKEELRMKLQHLKMLHDKHITSNRLGQLERDIRMFSTRLEILKNGVQKTLLLGKKSTQGVAQKYPVEYNQARDKILEREYD